MSAEHKACPWLSCFYLQIPVPLLGKKFTPPKDGSHFKNSRQLQSEYRSISYLMRRKNDVLFMQLSKKLPKRSSIRQGLTPLSMDDMFIMIALIAG